MALDVLVHYLRSGLPTIHCSRDGEHTLCGIRIGDGTDWERGAPFSDINCKRCMHALEAENNGRRWNE